MLSVREFAERKQISVPRVRELLGNGTIDHERIGRSIAIPESALAWKPMKARPLSPRMANALLSALSGNEVVDLRPVEKSRLVRHIREIENSSTPASLLDEKSSSRARPVRYWMPPASLINLSEDPRVKLSGVSGPRSGMTGGDVLEAYVSPSELEGLVKGYWLVEHKDGNVYLSASNLPGDYGAWVVADLARWGGIREVAEADRLLFELMVKQ